MGPSSHFPGIQVEGLCWQENEEACLTFVLCMSEVTWPDHILMSCAWSDAT